MLSGGFWVLERLLLPNSGVIALASNVELSVAPLAQVRYWAAGFPAGVWTWCSDWTPPDSLRRRLQPQSSETLLLRRLDLLNNALPFFESLQRLINNFTGVGDLSEFGILGRASVRMCPRKGGCPLSSRKGPNGAIPSGPFYFFSASFNVSASTTTCMRVNAPEFFWGIPHQKIRHSCLASLRSYLVLECPNTGYQN